MFADMYPSPNGRPSLPPQVLAVTGGLQALHGLSDFETGQELRGDLRGKAACGLGLLDGAFDPSLLSYFRRRVACSGDPNRLFFRGRPGGGGPAQGGPQGPGGSPLSPPTGDTPKKPAPATRTASKGTCRSSPRRGYSPPSPSPAAAARPTMRPPSPAACSAPRTGS